MTARLFDLGSCTCAVAASNDVLASMAHYLCGYASARGPIDFRLSLNCDPPVVSSVRRSLESLEPVATRSSHPEQQYHVWDDQGRQVLLPLAEKDHVIWRQGSYINITAETPRITATVGTRVLRQLIMRGGEARGGRTVHAGAVGLHDAAILIGGRAGAGKTTVITHLIEHHGAQPLSNDRTAVIPTSGGWTAVTVPLAWRYTPEGLHSSPALSAAARATTLVRGNELVDGKIELTPLEVSQALVRSPLSSAPIGQIVVLSRTTAPVDFGLAPLSFGEDNFFVEDWLNLRGELGSGQPSDDFWTVLHDHIPVRALSWTDPAELRGIAASIAQRVHG